MREGSSSGPDQQGHPSCFSLGTANGQSQLSCPMACQTLLGLVHGSAFFPQLLKHHSHAVFIHITASHLLHWSFYLPVLKTQRSPGSRLSPLCPLCNPVYSLLQVILWDRLTQSVYWTLNFLFLVEVFPSQLRLHTSTFCLEPTSTYHRLLKSGLKSISQRLRMSRSGTALAWYEGSCIWCPEPRTQRTINPGWHTYVTSVPTYAHIPAIASGWARGLLRPFPQRTIGAR